MAKVVEKEEAEIPPEMLQEVTAAAQARPQIVMEKPVEEKLAGGSDILHVPANIYAVKPGRTQSITEGGSEYRRIERGHAAPFYVCAAFNS